MGLSFLSLLYLQVSYIEEMMKTRKEQFDMAVRNSLDQVSKDVEYAETQRWLIEDISEAERKALIENNPSLQQNNMVQQTQRFTMKSKDGKVYTDFELKVMTTKPSELPKAMISPYRGSKTIPETSFLRIITLPKLVTPTYAIILVKRLTVSEDSISNTEISMQRNMLK